MKRILAFSATALLLATAAVSASPPGIMGGSEIASNTAERVQFKRGKGKGFKRWRRPGAIGKGGGGQCWARCAAKSRGLVNGCDFRCAGKRR